MKHSQAERDKDTAFGMPLTNVTLATVIPNRYTPASAPQLADAITDVCSAIDTLGFASSGIYIFWDFASREVLYIGLAVDLGLRFRQHNGLIECDDECCKRGKIAEHFTKNPDLGYTALVQSPLDQAMCASWVQAFPEELDLIAEEFGYLDAEEAHAVINAPYVRALRWMEGVLIRGHKAKHGGRPLWNRNSGAQLKYTDNELARAVEVLKTAAFVKSDYLHLTSHCAMTELSSNPTYLGFESFLHGVRLGTRAGSSMVDAAQRLPDGPAKWQRMKAAGYLAKTPLP